MNAKLGIALWAAAVLIVAGIAAFTYDDSDGTDPEDQRAAETAVLKIQDLPAETGWTARPSPPDDPDADPPAGLSEQCERVTRFLSGSRLDGATSQAESQHFRRPAPAAVEGQIPGEQSVEAAVTYFRSGKEQAALAFFLEPNTPGCFGELVTAGARQILALSPPVVEALPPLVGTPGTRIRVTTSLSQPPVPITVDFHVVVQGRGLVAVRSGAVNAAAVPDPELAAMIQAMLARLPAEPATTTTSTTSTAPAAPAPN